MLPLAENAIKILIHTSRIKYQFFLPPIIKIYYYEKRKYAI